VDAVTILKMLAALPERVKRDNRVDNRPQSRTVTRLAIGEDLAMSHRLVIRAATLSLLAIACAVGLVACNGGDDGHKLAGTVKSGSAGLGGYNVSLYASLVDRADAWQLLAVATTDAAGNFQLFYDVPAERAVLVVFAERGPAMLASAIGYASDTPATIVVNERTTVATGNAFAQFVRGRRIDGNAVGMINAVRMAGNLAHPGTGDVGEVLARSPNGFETPTLPTFNSLANAVAACVRSDTACQGLLAAGTPPGGAEPDNVLQALANIVRNPSYPGYPVNQQDPIWRLSIGTSVYEPALAHRPTSWLLFLKITGGFYSKQDSSNLMNGPGNFAIDELGYVYFDTNYIPQATGDFACASNRAVKLTPWGENAPGSPFFGGGLSGQGFGVIFDPIGRLWIANFGFQDPPCEFLPQKATKNSVSLFTHDLVPLSPPLGITQGNISWPQGISSDRQGNVWVANCGNDTVTLFRNGDPSQAMNIAVGPTPPANDPQIKPFGTAVDREGNLWVTGNRSNAMYVFSPAGALIDTLHGTYNGRTVITKPIGNAVDSQGNVWVANSDWLDSPCPTRNVLGSAGNPSISMFRASDRTPHPDAPFTGGGITLPWGVTVDGDDTVWVMNFGVTPPGPNNNPSRITGLSRLCGVDTSKCPPGLSTGDPISPPTGYQTTALQRMTAGAVDPSGNLWLTNNWKIDADPFQNPGGNAVVIAIGAAAPIKTPVIGPPEPLR
jgi:hypothetical protein